MINNEEKRFFTLLFYFAAAFSAVFSLTAISQKPVQKLGRFPGISGHNDKFGFLFYILPVPGLCSQGTEQTGSIYAVFLQEKCETFFLLIRYAV